MRLDREDIEALAARLAELLRAEPGAELVDAAELARRFGVSRDYVYAHAEELGAVRLGRGPRARLRFDPARVAEQLSAKAPEPAARRTRRRRGRADVKLLPIRGRTAL